VVTAVFSAGVAFVFLVPGQTRSFFTPKPGAGARFGFGLLSMVALSIALGLTAFSVGSLAPEDRREEVIGLIGGALQVVTILFLVMFFVPGYYSTRLRERALASAAAQREADRRAAIMAAVRGDPEVQTTAAGDWQARLSAYESRRTSAPARQPEPQTRRQPPRRSLLEKTIAFVGLMPVVVAFFVIFYADAMAQFVPTAELAALIPQVRVPLAIALTILCIAGALTAETNRAGAVKNTPLRIILFGGIGALVGLFGAESLLARGLPGLHSFFVSAPASQITLEVTEIGSERVRRGCDYTVYARGVDYVGPESTKLCEVGAEVWAGLQVGNRIVLNGYATPFGFRYDRVTK
jgi:hypothetical protein